MRVDASQNRVLVRALVARTLIIPAEGIIGHRTQRTSRFRGEICLIGLYYFSA